MGQVQTLPRRRHGDVVAGVGVAADPRAGIVPKYAANAFARRLAASQTMTTPACGSAHAPAAVNEIDTQVARRVFSSAFSSGQSETASSVLHGLGLSVGLATEPFSVAPSRWCGQFAAIDHLMKEPKRWRCPNDQQMRAGIFGNELRVRHVEPVMQMRIVPGSALDLASSCRFPRISESATSGTSDARQNSGRMYPARTGKSRLCDTASERTA